MLLPAAFGACFVLVCVDLFRRLRNGDTVPCVTESCDISDVHVWVAGRRLHS